MSARQPNIFDQTYAGLKQTLSIAFGGVALLVGENPAQVAQATGVAMDQLKYGLNNRPAVPG